MAQSRRMIAKRREDLRCMNEAEFESCDEAELDSLEKVRLPTNDFLSCRKSKAWRIKQGSSLFSVNSGRSDLFIENQMPISYFVFQRRGLNLHLPSHVSPAPLKNKIKQEHRFSINRPLLTEL